MTIRRLPQMVELAALKRETALAALSAATAENARLRQKIADLRGAAAEARKGAADVADMQRADAHARWTMQQVGVLNLELAARTAAWMGLRHDAAQAFGKADVLRQLAEHQAAERLVALRKCSP